MPNRHIAIDNSSIPNSFSIHNSAFSIAMKSIVVHYQEIALKGKNRPWFVARLVRNLREATADLDVARCASLHGADRDRARADGADWAAVRDRIAHGLRRRATSRAPAARRSTSTRSPRRSCNDLGDREPATFRVSARRADKRFPLTLAADRARGRRPHQGGARLDASNLGEPELTIHVEALTDEAFYFFGKERGAGGLPVGASGRVACLLSGGIDSPVAAWRMMRRGCRVLFVHFHSYPILSRASQEKARELAQLLTRFQFRSRLFLVPVRRDPAAGRARRAAAAARGDLPPADDAHRRARSRASNRAQALVTGDVVGQVASQTLENLTAIGERRDDAGAAAAGRHGQGRDHRRGAAARHLSRSRSSRTRTAARCSRRATRRPRRKPRDVERAEADAADRRDRRAGAVAAPRRVEHFRVSCDAI